MRNLVPFQQLFSHVSMFSSRTIVIDFRHRFTIININDTPVPIGHIGSFIGITVNP